MTTGSDRSERPPSDGSITLGLLLVHGIGTQRRGDTLVAWLDAIVDTIASATRNEATVTVEWADLAARAAADGPTPPHATVRIQADGVDERWMVAEAWWAEAFAAPSFGQLVSWSFRAIPWTIAMHAAQRYRSRDELGGRRRRLLARAGVAARALVMLFLAPFVLLALILLLLVGLIPIGALRTTVGRLQRALAAAAGDSMVFLESPVRSAAMCAEVGRALAWLRAACGPRAPDRIVALAHSQGATIMVETLRRLETRVPREAAPHEGTARQASVLVTFGAGINKLAALRVLGRDGAPVDQDRALTRDPIRLACLCLLVVAAAGAWFWQLIATGRISPRQLWLVPVLWFAGSLLLGGAVAGAQRLVRAFGGPRPWLGKVLTIATAGLLLASVAGGIALALATDTEVMPFFVLFVSLMMLAATLRVTLSEDMQEHIVRAIETPGSVGGWLDYWASADPVPNGSTRTRRPDVPLSTRIWNESSLVRDHTTYWRNRDGFVLPVVRILARVARSGWASRLPPERNDVAARSRWRTGWLRTTRWAVPLAFVLVGLRRGRELEAIRLKLAAATGSPGVATWLSWLPPGLWAFAFRWGVVAAAGWVAYRVLLAVWQAWVRAEQDKVLHAETPTRVPVGLQVFGAAAGLLIGGALLLVRTEWSDVQSVWQGTDLGDLVVTLWVVVACSLALVWLGAKLFPPPDGPMPRAR